MSQLGSLIDHIQRKITGSKCTLGFDSNKNDRTSLILEAAAAAAAMVVFPIRRYYKAWLNPLLWVAMTAFYGPLSTTRTLLIRTQFWLQTEGPRLIRSVRRKKCGFLNLSTSAADRGEELEELPGSHNYREATRSKIPSSDPGNSGSRSAERLFPVACCRGRRW